MSCGFELTDSNAACFKTDRILAPQNKFKTEFTATFTDPKQRNSSVKLGKLKKFKLITLNELNLP